MHNSALSGIRIGCVPYLNARPLVWEMEEQVDFKTPSVLAEHFAAGMYDVALIPLSETLRTPNPQVVDGVCISCLGAVHTVILAHQEPLEEIQEIVLDPASRTSANLLQILLKEYFRLSPRLVTKSENTRAARLIIGDAAIAFRNTLEDISTPKWQILDLGQVWHEWTKLPFVFAVWTFKKNGSKAPAVAEALRAIAAAGKTARPLIAARESHPPSALKYLTQHIRYQLGGNEKIAIAHFSQLLKNIDSTSIGYPTFL